MRAIGRHPGPNPVAINALAEPGLPRCRTFRLSTAGTAPLSGNAAERAAVSPLPGNWPRHARNRCRPIEPHRGDFTAFRLGPLRSLCADCHNALDRTNRLRHPVRADALLSLATRCRLFFFHCPRHERGRIAGDGALASASSGT